MMVNEIDLQRCMVLLYMYAIIDTCDNKKSVTSWGSLESVMTRC